MISMRFGGLAVIAFTIAFNVPFSLLAGLFDYPAILRRPAGEVLATFNAGGGALIMVWYAFMLCALALVPLALGLAASTYDRDRFSWLPPAAAICGALAGVVQAVGLSRWVFVVPSLARDYASPGASEAVRLHAERTFEMLNHWGGVAIGEHIGQVLTCLWVGFMLLSVRERPMIVDKIILGFGLVAIAAIVIGLGDGLSIALGAPNRLFRQMTVVGYLALTGWLIAMGIRLIRGNSGAATMLVPN